MKIAVQEAVRLRTSISEGPFYTGVAGPFHVNASAEALLRAHFAAAPCCLSTPCTYLLTAAKYGQEVRIMDEIIAAPALAAFTACTIPATPVRSLSGAAAIAYLAYLGVQGRSGKVYVSGVNT